VDQTWTYQMGAVFLTQEGKTTVRVAPSISVASVDGNISIDITPIRLEGSATIAGSGPARVETRMCRSGQSTLSGQYNVVNLTLDGSDDQVMAAAWKRAFDEVKARAWMEGVDNISTGLDDSQAWLVIEVPPNKVILNVYPANYTVTIHNAASLLE